MLFYIRSGKIDSRAEYKDIDQDQNDGYGQQKPVWFGGKRIEESALLRRQDIHNAREHEAPEEWKRISESRVVWKATFCP